MDKCQKYVEEAQSNIEDSHDATNAIFHCLEFLAKEIDKLHGLEFIATAVDQIKENKKKKPTPPKGRLIKGGEIKEA